MDTQVYTYSKDQQDCSFQKFIVKIGLIFSLDLKK